MKNVYLASSLFATLALSAFGVDQSEVRAQIAAKEKELLALQKELSALRDQLSSAPTVKRYTVRTGDTVHSIARKHKVAPDDLMSWNDITDPTKLAIGEELVLSNAPARAAQPSSVPVAQPKAPRSAYTVTKGDTFYSIARRHQMTVTELKALNPDVSPDLITTGQALRVSGQPVASAPRATPALRKESKVTAPKLKPTPKPKPKPEPRAIPKTIDESVLPPAKPAPVKESPTPPRTDLLEKPKPAPIASTVILDEVVTFDEFAQKYGTSTEVLNKLNGWNLPKATVLARGSEINVPN